MARLSLNFCLIEYVLLRILLLWLLGSYLYLAFMGGIAFLWGSPEKLYYGLFESIRLWFSGSFWIAIGLSIKNRRLQKNKVELALVVTLLSSIFLIAQSLFFPLDTHAIAPSRIDSGETSSNIFLGIYGSKNLIEALLRELVLELNLGFSAILLIVTKFIPDHFYTK